MIMVILHRQGEERMASAATKHTDFEQEQQSQQRLRLPSVLSVSPVQEMRMVLQFDRLQCKVV